MKTVLLALVLIVSNVLQAQSPPKTELVKLPVRISLTGEHHSYIQTYQGIPIYNARLDEFYDHDGKLRWSSNRLVQLKNPPFYSFAQKPINAEWFFHDDELFPGTWKIADTIMGVKELIFENQVLATKNTKLFNRLPDSTVHAQVFLINPLNTAERRYGSPYIDSSDLDVPELNAERKWVTMKAHYDNGTFHLKTDWLEFGEVSSPTRAPVTSTTDTFSYTRSQYEFEDVNAFYHITRVAERIESLGFSRLIPDTLLIDAHGYNGSDLSSFNFEVFPVELEFGEGGVDDAEDGEVVIHEFGHALSYTASPGTVEGDQRAAMEEGLCDYFSTTYGREITDFGWKEVFNWDGHNEFWNGIRTGTDKIFPTDLTGDLNKNRELWSTPLICLYDKLGRDKSDSLVLEHLFFQTKNNTMPQMAKTLLLIDTLFWGGQYYYDIKECFVRHQILEWGVGIETSTESSPFSVSNSMAFAAGSGILEISSAETGRIEIDVYDASGRVIFSTFSDQIVKIHPEQLSRGIYHVLIRQNDVNLSTKVIRTE